MAKVEFLGPINKENLEVDISNLEELKDILHGDKTLEKWLDICSVAVNNTLVSSLDMEIKKDDIISLLPPVCGG